MMGADYKAMRSTMLDIEFNLIDLEDEVLSVLDESERGKLMRALTDMRIALVDVREHVRRNYLV